MIRCLLEATFLKEYSLLKHTAQYFLTGRMGLILFYNYRHFKKGDLKLKCTATLAALYWQSNEASAEPDRPVHHQRSSSSGVYLDGQSTSTLASAALTIHFLGGGLNHFYEIQKFFTF